MTTILFDLDGTLIDSADGILSSMRIAFAELGVPEPPGGLGRDLLGPPLHTSLPPLVGPAAAEVIVPVYRRIYVEHGMREHRPFAGIDTLLRELAAAGVVLAVATSKLERFAEQIVAANGWAPLFRTVCGETVEKTRPTKADVVRVALARLGDPDDAVMVGDRSHDVIGARANGLSCLGVAWGYAGPGELETAGASTICADVDALRGELTTRTGIVGELDIRRTANDLRRPNRPTAAQRSCGGGSGGGAGLSGSTDPQTGPCGPYPPA